MSADKALHCDCGYRLRAWTEERRVAEVRRHAWEAHAISFSTEEALVVLLRLELEGGALADLGRCPFNLGSAVNTGAAGSRPSLSWHAEQLLFGLAPGPEGSSDIYITTREKGT
jgi:hypothetical protein